MRETHSPRPKCTAQAGFRKLTSGHLGFAAFPPKEACRPGYSSTPVPPYALAMQYPVLTYRTTLVVPALRFGFSLVMTDYLALPQVGRRGSEGGGRADRSACGTVGEREHADARGEPAGPQEGAAALPGAAHHRSEARLQVQRCHVPLHLPVPVPMPAGPHTLNSLGTEHCTLAHSHALHRVESTRLSLSLCSPARPL
eukprot:1328134-Rhodomonas_salina.3